METVAVICLWLASNISIGNITKWVYEYGSICAVGQSSKHCQTYKFPLAITALHMVCSWAFCYVYIFLVRSSPPSKQIYGRQRLAKVGPLAACFAASVAMGNLALEYIFPSFNQMVGSASPLITFAMAVAFTNTQSSIVLWLSMLPICGGMIICAENEANFSMLGLALALGATVLRATKSIIQGQLLSSTEDKLDSATLLYYMSPYAACMLLVSSLVMEGYAPVTLLIQGAGVSFNGLPAATGSRNVIVLVLLSGINAFLLNISTFLVTAYTSAVMLQVLGNVKSCVGIVISVLIFRNPLSRMQGVGVLVCLFGVWVYQRETALLKAAAAASKEILPESKPTPSIPFSIQVDKHEKVYGACV